jgi:hypothetical protein
MKTQHQQMQMHPSLLLLLLLGRPSQSLRLGSATCRTASSPMRMQVGGWLLNIWVWNQVMQKAGKTRELAAAAAAGGAAVVVLLLQQLMNLLVVQIGGSLRPG